MTRVIEDYTGKREEIDCIGCHHSALGDAVKGALVVTDLFHAHQDHEIPIPGFIILATRRHIGRIDEMTDEEATEFMSLVRRIRHAMRTALGIHEVYLVQEEDTDDHFHLWLLPRYDWMKDETKFGHKVSSARPVLEYARTTMKTPENIAAVDAAIATLRQSF